MRVFELHFHSTSWKQPILTKGDTGAATEANCDKSKSITATIVEEYASNQEQWVLDFADVYDRMMANGYDINQLQVSVMTVIVNPIHGGLYRWRENTLPIFLFQKLKEILTLYSRTILKASKN